MVVPVVHTTRCTRSRLKSSECDLCVQACDERAIRLTPVPEIDVTACTKCERCAAACPTEALLGAASKLDSSIKTVECSDEARLVCSLAPRDSNYGRVGCLGGLNAEDLVSLAVLTKHSVRLNAQLCRECQAGEAVRAGLTEELDRAEASRVVATEQLPRINTESRDSEAQAAKLGRRGFFATIFQATREVPSLVDRALAGATPEDVLRIERSERRRRVREVLGVVERAQFDRYFVYEVELTKACDHCCRCVGFCPTGALRRGRVGGRKRLLVEEADCTGCMVCAEFCGTRGIVVQRRAAASLCSAQ
jgi:Pyruvate/2-oxoacid:ferredoxin oxidoreductase delta subunit